jgi:hypothetical protein
MPLVTLWLQSGVQHACCGFYGYNVSFCLVRWRRGRHDLFLLIKHAYNRGVKGVIDI